jgi:hypothetical protein
MAPAITLVDASEYEDIYPLFNAFLMALPIGIFLCFLGYEELKEIDFKKLL